MTTTPYNGSVGGPIVVNNGDEADLNGATLTSNNNGVQGLGAVTVKLVGSTILSTNRGITDDASGTLTVTLDGGSTITGSDGIGSDSALIALTNGGMITSNASGGNGVFVGQNGSTIVNSGAISGGSGQYAINANATATITNSGTISAGQSGALEFGAGGGALNLSNGVTAGTITGGIVTSGALTVSNNGVANYGLASVISGSGSLRVIGGGFLMLSGANTYTGGTTVTASTVAVGHTTAGVLDALGSGAVALNNAILFIGSPGVLTNPITVDGAATLGGGGFTLQSTISGAGSLTYNVPAVTLTGVDNRTQGATNLVNFVTVTATTPNTLSQVSDYNLASNSTLSIGSASLPPSTVFSIGSLSGAGTVQANQPSKIFALSVGATGASSTFSGVLTQTMGGALQLSKVGAGVLTLTGANTNAAGANIGAGTLQIGNGGTTGSITGAVTDNAVLQFSRSDATTFAGAISGSGAVTVDSGGTLTLSNTNTYTGGTTVTGGATLVANHTDPGGGGIDALGSGAVTLDNGVLSSGTYDGVNNAVIVGAGGATLAGAGFAFNGGFSGAGAVTFATSVGLVGADTRTQGATVLAGNITVDASRPSGLSAQSDFSVAAGATLRLDGFGMAQTYTVGSLSGAGSVSVRRGAVTTLSLGAPGASTTFSGVLQDGGGPLALTKTGAGVFTLTGANTYTGATTVSGGVLAVDGSLTSAVTVASGATLRGVGSTTGAVTVQSGGFLAPGDSPGVLHTGALTLAGTLNAELGGTATGAFDQLAVTGTVKLNGATLNASLFGGFTLAIGQSFKIIDNDGTADAVTGTFAGLSQGATFTLGGQLVSVNYAGGDGNDVVLSVVAPPPPPPSAPQQTPSQQAGLPAGFSNIARVGPTSADATTPGTPLYAQAQAEQAIEQQYDSGRLFIQDAMLAQYHLVDGTTSLAVTEYAFFTGRTPTAAGLNYLVHSATNGTDLNDPYYQSFNTENRYINVAVGLGTGGGAGAAAFSAAYGSLSLTDAATKAYTAVFGVAPAAGKIDAILNAQVPNGLGGTETRAQYLADVSGGTSIAQKAAIVGFFLSDGQREGSAYANADFHFLADLAHGTAAYNVDLLTYYGPAPQLVGPPVADTSVPQ